MKVYIVKEKCTGQLTHEEYVTVFKTLAGALIYAFNRKEKEKNNSIFYDGMGVLRADYEETLCDFTDNEEIEGRVIYLWSVNNYVIHENRESFYIEIRMHEVH